MDDKTTADHESGSDEDTDDGNSNQTQNRLPPYSTGEKKMRLRILTNAGREV